MATLMYFDLVRRAGRAPRLKFVSIQRHERGYAAPHADLVVSRMPLFPLRFHSVR